jgi:hypothetical protein
LEILTGARAVGVRNDDPFKVSLNGKAMTDALAVRNQVLETSIETVRTGTKTDVSAALQLDPSGWAFQNLSELSAIIEKKSGETRAFETLKIRFQQQKVKIAEQEKLIEALTKEIARIETESAPLLEKARTARGELFVSFFEILKREQVEVSKLYAPLQKTLDEGSETDKRLRFEARIAYDLAGHSDNCLSIIDRTKKGNFRELLALPTALTKLWEGFERGNFTPDTIKQGLKNLWEKFTKLEEDEKVSAIGVQSQLRDGCTMQTFFDWLLDVNPFRVTSSLTFDDKDLTLLSPGQKGIVLLMLFLGMDHADTRPLIIDQPEDNLDNLSVYRDLIRLFRNRKKYRQIILVTHNPNLVVNTDAEQVLIASYDGKATPRIEYLSGSLEDQAEYLPDVSPKDLTDGIIERVCDVLEGGPNAFSKRSKVYGLSPKIDAR